MLMSRFDFLEIATMGMGALGFAAAKASAAGGPLEKAQAEATRLKVTGVDIYAYDLPLKSPFRIAIGTMPAANDVLVRVHTDAGITGVGEACPFPPITGETQETNLAAAKALREIVLGRNPLAIESLFREFGAFVHSNPSATAAFDTALHDILGKIAGLPLFRLLGGDRTSFATDITVDLDEPETMARRAREFAAAGFDIIKIKVGQGQDLDLRRLEAVRAAVGPDIVLQIDANQGWAPPVAIDTLRKMERFNILFVEQPVLASDFDGLRAVKAASPIPVMADEAAFGPADVLKLAKAEACDYVNIKLMKAGGLGNMSKMAHIADGANMACMVGCMLESRLALTAAAHIVAARRNILWTDLDGHTSHTIDPVTDGMTFAKGLITLPEKPGIGAEVDPDFLKTLKKF
ncbi:MAG: dipeptide epimerase [Candidatus Aminicenantes bacterium]|nr:dipeptide epimerase [Candidatus Aminicenantes bacterium]